MHLSCHRNRDVMRNTFNGRGCGGGGPFGLPHTAIRVPRLRPERPPPMYWNQK